MNTFLVSHLSNCVKQIQIKINLKNVMEINIINIYAYR